MCKRLFTMLLVVIMIVGIIPQISFAASDYYDQWGIYFDKATGTITDAKSYISGDLVIPDTIDGVKVTTIGVGAFSSCDSLTSVTIGNSVTTIGKEAFYFCDSLTSVTIGNSVTTIGKAAFNLCYSLTSVTIGNSVTTIGSGAFAGCGSLTSVTIGNSVTTIGGYAFAYCYSLTSVTIGNSVTTIGEYAFYDCDSLTSVTIGNSVTTIGKAAFNLCYSLTDVYYSGSEADWGNIDIGDYNECLTDATIHYNIAVSGKTDSIISVTDLSKLRITVYENNNESSKLADSYQLSAGAVAKRDGNESVSGSNGIVVLPKGNGDVVISKTDYLSRTISNERAVKNSNIYLQKEVNNRPVIQAVWIGETDVYTKEYKVDITSKKSVTLEAEVVWCGDSRSKLYLMQDSRRVEFSENT